MDKVTGLEIGADDYVTKPVGSRELVARVKAILRRAGEKRNTGDTFQFGDVTVDFQRYEVFRQGKRIHLTSLEFRLLRYFIERRGSVRTEPSYHDCRPQRHQQRCRERNR